MAELADALASGASGRKAVEVQLLFRPHFDFAQCKPDDWLSWLERCIHIAQAGGSNPSSSTIWQLAISI